MSKVGNVAAKKLIAYCGCAEAIFKESRQSLMMISVIGPAIANSIVSQDLLSAAEFELGFMEQNDVKPIYFMDVIILFDSSNVSMLLLCFM